MVNMLESGWRVPGLSPGREHCVVFLSMTPDSLSASLLSDAKMGTGEFNAGGNLVGPLAHVQTCYGSYIKFIHDS